uniref:Toprim domain-containing protein n=1 Tax=Yersinia enterocolitica W22703 TaxID=913028 RepID=F4MXM6_YEREN|nr:hypothetical protein YEW_KV45940 [Yersinia enterocolitica W22703]
MLLPLTDIDGKLTGGQLISPLGDKRLLPNTVLKGAFIAVHPLEAGDNPELVVITEGYATALTLDMLTDGLVVAAVAANNLPNVAQHLRHKWPDARLIIAGDNDFDDGKENTGKQWAEKAAKAVDGWVSLPPTRHKADWDDYRRDNGLERAKEAFREEMILFGKGKTKLPQGSA